MIVHDVIQETSDGAVEPVKKDRECQFHHPMIFCSVCGTWLHCKDEEGPWVKRPRDDG